MIRCFVRQSTWDTHRPVAALLVCALAACASGGGGEVTVRDSAGIQIVEHPGADAPLPQWTVDAEPKVSIGVLEGDAAYQLDQVRASVLHGDRIIVANGGSMELRAFDLEGKHIATGGRKGGGPGEFQSIRWMSRFDGDSVIIYDPNNRRFSIFSLDAQFGRSFAPEQQFFSVAGRLADGSYILPPTLVFSTSDGPRNGLVRDSTTVIRVSATGDAPDTLLVLIGGETYIQTQSSGGQVTSMWVRTAPFAHNTTIAVGDSIFYTATGDRYEISGWAPDGRLVRLIRRNIHPAAVAQADIDRYKQEQMETARDDNARRDLEKALAEMPYPERMPAHGPIRMDNDGNLWVQDYSPWTREPTRWTVFAADGRAIGSVTLPARFTVHQIGSDYVLGLIRDDLDVEQVVVLGLARSASREIADARPSH